LEPLSSFKDSFAESSFSLPPGIRPQKMVIIIIMETSLYKSSARSDEMVKDIYNGCNDLSPNRLAKAPVMNGKTADPA
jgi:hypothetical protein